MLLALTFICILYFGLTCYSKHAFKIIGIIATPFIKLYLIKRIANGLEDGTRKTERFGIPSHVRPFGKLIWIHAVSIGEVLSVIPFVNGLREIHKRLNVVVTTTTLQSAKLMQEQFPELIIHQFAPFDVFAWVRRFIKFWKPDAVFFVESELWPNTLSCLSEIGIPTYLLNTKISNKSIKRLYLLKKYFNILPLKPFREVFVTTKEMKNHAIALGAQKVSINSNIKMIANRLPTDDMEIANLRYKFGKRHVWIAVSTHKGEEEIIIEAHKQIKAEYSNILTVIAIRHPSRANEVIELCKIAGTTSALHTRVNEEKIRILDDIYIVDQLGVLGNFFEIIEPVLVCGSLVSGIGGHNIIEPLNFQCNVATGQYIEKCEDMYQALEGCCCKVNNLEEIVNFVKMAFAKRARIAPAREIKGRPDSWRNTIRRISAEMV
jgi:3-deoxy-D-manno-octulosonic-acid transferase